MICGTDQYLHLLLTGRTDTNHRFSTQKKGPRGGALKLASVEELDAGLNKIVQVAVSLVVVLALAFYPGTELCSLFENELELAFAQLDSYGRVNLSHSHFVFHFFSYFTRSTIMATLAIKGS